MAVLALVLCVLYAVALFGVRELVAATGGWARAATRWEWVANRLVLAAWLLSLLGPALVLAGALRPIAALDGPAARAAGLVLAVASLAGGVLAQATMRSAWRTGIDPAHPSALVMTGVFAHVRNPVYTTMTGVALGAALLVPTAAGALAVAVCVGGLEIQTRLVEEPHLRALHGARYERYAARTGRFLPRIGRLG
jgi:protein-S-isoprenylcysteine O-methyltransferase Ste14